MKRMAINRCSRSLAIVVFALGAFSAHAAVSPVSVSIVRPIQFPSEEVMVAGARASLLWGSHRRVYGVDIGVLGNMTSVRSGGVAISGLFNFNRGETSVLGLQLAGLTNINVGGTTVLGVQAAAGTNSNRGEATLVGLQIAGLANFSDHTKIWGAQVGVFNSAREVRGFQIGLVNVTDKLYGLQIGLVNIHKQGLFRVCPVINFGF